MYEYNARLLKVIDGDTFDLTVDVGFHITIHERFRLMNIDTPELFSPRSEAEKTHAIAAKAACMAVLQGDLRIQVFRKGYYKRYITRILFRNDKAEWESLSDYLKDLGLEKQPSY